MRAQIRPMGNSAGIILPKPVLADLGVKTGDELSLTIEDGRVVLSPLPAHPRAGWAEASKALAASGDDALVWPEFANEGDDTIEW